MLDVMAINIFDQISIEGLIRDVEEEKVIRIGVTDNKKQWDNIKSIKVVDYIEEEKCWEKKRKQLALIVWLYQ